MYGSQKSQNEEKIDNDHVLRNYHRIKTMQPISIFLVSFFLNDNVLFDLMKSKYANFFNITVTKIKFCFLGDTQYRRLT